MGLSNEVTGILDTLVSGVKQSLGHNLLGVYLRGSLATGGFIPETSDIDVLVVTEQPVDDRQFAGLKRLHDRISESPNPYARRLEAAYIDRGALRNYRAGLRHPTLGQGEELAWSEHQANWLLERWVVRAYGVVLCGPHPERLIDPVSSEQIAQAVRSRIGDWVAWAQDVNDPDWQLPRSHKAYVIETMCRVLYTSKKGVLSSKAEAVEWALETLPEPWRTLVKRSQVWRTDNTTDPLMNLQVREFVLWVASSVQDAA